MTSSKPTLVPALTDAQFEHIRSSGGLTSTQVQHVLTGIKGLTTINELEHIPNELFESIRRSGSLTSGQVQQVLDGVMHAASVEFAFDITLAGAMRVWAPHQAAAEHLLRRKLDSAYCKLGAWENGLPITAECSLIGAPSVFEIDGEEVRHLSKGTPFDLLKNACQASLKALAGKPEHAELIQQLRDTLEAVGD